MQAVAKWVGAPSNCSEHIAEAGACRQRHVSKEPCVRVVGRSKVMHERIVKNSSRRLLSREACASCRQGAPRAVLRVRSVAVRGTLKGAPEPAAGNLAWGPRRWL